MDEKRKTFTYIWKIKNFNFIDSSPNECFFSPSFFVREMCRTNWHLVLLANSTLYHDCVVFRLQGKCSGPDEFEFDYELSFLTGDGFVIHSEIFLSKVFKNEYWESHSSLAAKIEEVFVHKKNLYLPDDTITVRCRMWKSQGSISQSARCSVGTRFNTKSRYFVGTFENFSSIKKSSKNVVSVQSPEKEFELPSINLCVDAYGKLDIEVNIDYERNTTYKYKVCILDEQRNKVKCCQEDIHDSPSRIPLTFSTKHLIENKEYYIPNDVLTLHCELIFPTSQKCNIIGELEITHSILYEYGCQQDIQAAISNVTTTKPFSEEHQTESLTTMRDDFISLFREGILSDTKLKTATETFPAHTAVLSARSPVFKSMFTTDMREKTNNCVDIDDLDADTVRQMLLFMYSDTLDYLDCERAKSVYFAADKYSIVSLRHRCSNFLKQHILCSNCCDILLLADRHQDKDLKGSVQGFIAKNDEAVFSSEEWKDLEENHPRLTTETFRAVYMENRRT